MIKFLYPLSIFGFFDISRNIVVQYYSSTVLQSFLRKGKERKGVDFY